MVQTATASTRDWLDSVAHLGAATYVGSGVSWAGLIPVPCLPGLGREVPSWSWAAHKAAVGTAPPRGMPDLTAEFDAWDALSDEAFLRFEGALGDDARGHLDG